MRSIPHVLGLKADEWVEVRSKTDILSTLDEKGRLDELPFMPQMLEHCGRKLRVSKQAHKLCDTVHGTGARRMKDAVFLEDLRCDGQAFGGCEMRCLLYWKEAWLKRVDDGAREAVECDQEISIAGQLQTEAVAKHGGVDLLALTRPKDKQTPGTAPVYVCQATQMPYATTPLSVWDIRQYVEDFRSGNATLGQIVMRLGFLIYSEIAASGLGFGSFLRWAYDTVQRLRGGWVYPARPGHIPRNGRTPSSDVQLRVGDWVRVKSQQEILNTVTENLLNRGMSFHPEMVPYCGKEFRVAQRLRRIINEKTGQLMELKNECLVLEGAECIGRYTKPLLCPRGMPPYWRTIWLERVMPTTDRSTDNTIKSE